MNHMHEPEQDPLDIDRPGYYTPQLIEFHEGMEIEVVGDNQAWEVMVYTLGLVLTEVLSHNQIRVRYLQARDILELGFGRVAPTLPMYQRGSYTIQAYRLLDPTYSKVKISQNGVIVFEGHVKNKSELKRVLTLNEINFADN